MCTKMIVCVCSCVSFPTHGGRGRIIQQLSEAGGSSITPSVALDAWPTTGRLGAVVTRGKGQEEEEEAEDPATHPTHTTHERHLLARPTLRAALSA